MAAPYIINIVNGTGTADVAIPNAIYDISLSGTNLYYGATMYSDVVMVTVADEQEVSTGPETFTYYVKATGAATIRLVTEAGGEAVTDSVTDGVQVRRRVTVNEQTKYAGDLIPLESGEATVSTLPYKSGGTGPQITFEIDTNALEDAGFTLVGSNTVTMPVQSETATETIFEFIVDTNDKTGEIFDGNAEIYDTFASTTGTGTYVGIEEGTLTFATQTPPEP